MALIGYLVNPTNAEAEIQTKNARATAEMLDKNFLVVQARTDSELEMAFVTLLQQRAGALVIGADPFFAAGATSSLALQHIKKFRRFIFRDSVSAGGLMSYGSSVTEALRIVGVYTGRILNGEKPADLTVQQATKVELIISLKTAKAMGLTIPSSVLARADEVIE